VKARLTIERLNARKEPLGPEARIEVPYNPGELSFSKGANYADIAIPGLDAPVIQFVRGEAETLALELFFDSTERGRGANADSVMEEVDRLHHLVKLDGDLHSPPIVRLSWGQDFPGTSLGDGEKPVAALDAVVVSCARRFTLFSSEGKPLRATVSLQLREYMTLPEQLQFVNLRSADHTRVHVVRDGETLPLIAYDAYEDPAKWRVIAEHNGLRDARRVAPGTRLELPPVR
jgi:nucleoid-associated protein YgaU